MSWSQQEALGRVGSVVFRGFGGRLRVIFRLKESNIGLDKQLY